jgi:hypothetical protein
MLAGPALFGLNQNVPAHLEADDCRARVPGMPGLRGEMQGDPVKCQAGVALGVAGGYFLGRSKKIKLALILGSVAAGLRAGTPGQPLTIGPVAADPERTSRADTPVYELSRDGLPEEALPDDAGDESELGGRAADAPPLLRTNGVEDVDGSEVSETVLFGLDGRQYRLDLSTEEAAKLRESLAPFVEVARPRGKGSRGRRGRPGGRGS